MPDSTNADSWIDLSNQLANKIEAGIQALGEGLGTGAEFVWPMLVKQSYVEGIVSLIFCILGIIALAGSVKWIKWCLKKDDNGRCQLLYNDAEPAHVLGVVILTIAGSLMFIFGVEDAIGHLVNPEYYALKEVSSLIQSIIP